MSTQQSIQELRNKTNTLGKLFSAFVIGSLTLYLGLLIGFILVFKIHDDQIQELKQQQQLAVQAQQLEMQAVIQWQRQLEEQVIFDLAHYCQQPYKRCSLDHFEANGLEVTYTATPGECGTFVYPTGEFIYLGGYNSGFILTEATTIVEICDTATLMR